MRFAHDRVIVGEAVLPFEEVDRQGVPRANPVVVRRLLRDAEALLDQAKLRGRPFYYYSYGAAVSEVVIDTLTGEMQRAARRTRCTDVGASLNPALDIGQVEGAFIQGMGWLTTEELWWNAGGKLMTHAPSTYKIPTVNDTPPVFNVRLVQEPQRGGQHPSFEGNRRAAVAAAVFRVLCDSRRGVGSRRSSR